MLLLFRIMILILTKDLFTIGLSTFPLYYKKNMDGVNSIMWKYFLSHAQFNG